MPPLHSRLISCWQLWTAWVLVFALLLCTSVRASKWPDQRRIGPLVCHADFSLDPYISFFQDVANLQEDLLEQLGVGMPQEMIHLYLFSKKSSYRQYIQQHFPNVPDRRALFIKGHGPGMVFAYASGDFETDLRHECTHALLHASLVMVPLWLDEGLAEYFEVPAAKRVDGSPHKAAMRRNLFLGRYASLAELEFLSDVKDMSGKDYRHAWGWVHFMLNGPPEARQELQQFLSDIKNQVPPGNLSQRLNSRIPDLDRSFKRHFRRVKLARH